MFWLNNHMCCGSGNRLRRQFFFKVLISRIQIGDIKSYGKYAFTSRKTRDADLQRWAQEWADIMAGWTEQYPLQWFNFFDYWGERERGDE